MDKLKEALIRFADSNPSLFRHDGFNSYPSLIEQRFSQFFLDFQTPSHPPYAAMIHKAIVELNEKRGSSEESISKYIEQEHADLPWAHSTLLKHHLEKLCDRKEISITSKQRYLLPNSDSYPISISTPEKQLKRKKNSESGKKNSRHNKKRKKNGHLKKYKKKEKRVSDLQETNNQIFEVFQEQECLKIENQTYEEGNNLIDVCIQEMEESGVCANDKEQTEIQGKKKQKLKRKSKKRGKHGKKNEETQLQDSIEENLKQNNEEIGCEVQEKNPQNQGKRVWTKSQIKKMSNMPKDAEYLSEEKEQSKEAKQASRSVCTRKDVHRAKLRSFKKKEGVSNDKGQQKHKTCGRNKMPRRSSRKRKAPSRLD
ncbi:hypothetical protein L2E82_43017 [Cichorium intybus]|uniref:Uncharacterized protein n=1 Tax=Cichorium intybus TaxID=13427 RepID=A0ACB8ZNW5_CICIN|nr:hypothetical protein L2E82_43017 [Cichorium intybus]